MIVAHVLLSAFLHALWNALLRLEDDKDRALMAVVVATLFAAVVAGARWEAGGGAVRVAGQGRVHAARGTMEAAYFATLAKAMALGRLGVVYTISRGGAVLAVWPLSIAVFGEVAALPDGAVTASACKSAPRRRAMLRRDGSDRNRLEPGAPAPTPRRRQVGGADRAPR